MTSDDAQRYQEMLSAGLDLLDQGITVFDADLRMVAWNQPFLRLLEFPSYLAQQGGSFEEFIRFNAQRGEYGPGDVEQQIQQRVAAARTFRSHYTERVRPNGQVLAIRGYPLPHRGFISLYSDITEQRRYREQIQRHQAELEQHIHRRTAELIAANAELTAAIEANKQMTAALQRSEERLRRITDTIPASIAYFDKHWVYRYANKGYAEWFGWTSDQVTGREIKQIIGPATFDYVADHVRRALAGERLTYEYSMARADGSIVHARSTLLPDVDAEGEVVGCFVHSVDITEQRRTQNALAQAQKMEAIGQLTGGLAHDFNNLLTVVIGNLAALREHCPDDTHTSEYIDPAMHAAQRGAALIKRLLTFSRQQPLEPQAVEVHELVDGMSKLIRRSLPENISFEISTPKQRLVALIDAHQLESALLNLALNARDAMPNGGQLRIESSLEHLDKRTALDLELAVGDYVQIAVSDNGIGMDGSILARVFEPFFTTKPFGQGSGLGMAMVYGFVKQSGGSIRIRSRQAKGTTVALVLPLAPQNCNTHPVMPVSPLSKGDISGTLVLLAEDDSEVRKIVRTQLAQLGCTVLEAENGEEAADLIETVPSIALLISDVVMPGGLDGRALARFSRRFRPQLPIILMTGYADGALALDEAKVVLNKPFTRDALLTAIQACGQVKELHRDQ